MHKIFFKTPESFRGIFNAVRKDARKHSIWRKRSDMGFSISSAVLIHSSCRSCCNAKEWIMIYEFHRRISHHFKTYGPYDMVHTPEMNFWNEPFKTKRRTCRGSKSWWEDPAYCRMHRFSCWYYRIRQWDGRWCSWPVVQWKFASKISAY